MPCDPDKRKASNRLASQRYRDRKTVAEMASHAGKELPTRDELLRLLGQRARSGHVPAMRLLLEELRRDAEPGTSSETVIDELSKRRRRRKT